MKRDRQACSPPPCDDLNLPPKPPPGARDAGPLSNPGLFQSARLVGETKIHASDDRSEIESENMAYMPGQ